MGDVADFLHPYFPDISFKDSESLTSPICYFLAYALHGLRSHLFCCLSWSSQGGRDPASSDPLTSLVS